MRATFTDEQEALASTARDLAKGGREAARSLLEGGDHGEEPTRSLLAGFAGLAVPEAEGGAGGDLVDLAIVLEALARQVTPTPYVSHVLAVQVAHAAGLDVAEAAAGQVTWSLALDGGASRVEVVDGVVRGEEPAVRNGDACDEAVLVSADGVVLVAPPTERTRREPLDPTRPLADLRFDAPATSSASSGAGAGRQRVVALLAAELAGVARGAVDLAVEYAKVREQFGQPIGRFQGVAHQLADAWTAAEQAWSLALYATWAVSAGAADADRAVHAAKAKGGEAAIFAAERCTQAHGGIGITWEADPHLYLRRAIATDAWLGTAREHRRRLGELVVEARSG